MIKKEIGMDILYSDIFIFFSQKKHYWKKTADKTDMCGI